MSLHRKVHLDDVISNAFAEAGWLYDAPGATRYDRSQA